MGVTSYLTWEGEILSETRAGVESDYLPDPLGSSSALLNSSQAKTDTFSWWPYGERRSHSGTSVTRFGYVGTLGYCTDVISARIYIRENILMSDFTSWQAVDMLWPRTFEYAYAGSNPTSYVDPSGKKPQVRKSVSSSANCTVKICSQYGFNNPIVTHEYVCSTTYGGHTCAGGMYPNGNRGKGTVANESAPCKDYTTGKWPIICDTRTVDCAYASGVCLCLKFLRANPPGYSVPYQSCWQFKYTVDDCLCDKLGLCDYPLANLGITNWL